jgi:hypothetical protein
MLTLVGFWRDVVDSVDYGKNNSALIEKRHPEMLHVRKAVVIPGGTRRQGGAEAVLGSSPNV